MHDILKIAFSLENTSYWLPILWCVGCGLILRGMPKKTELILGRYEERWYWFSALLLTLPLILWAGYRGYYGDTYAYTKMFTTTPASLTAIPNLITTEDDWGYYIFMAVLKAMGVQSSNTFFLILAAVQVFCMIYGFRRYSSSFWICIFLFIASTDYMSWMQNGIRQFTAACITFAATELLVQQRYRLFIIVVLLTSTIHGSALLMLPFAYVMTGPPLNRKTMMMISATAIIVPFVDTFTPILEQLLFDTQYNDIMSNAIWANDDGTNIIRVLVYSVPALVAMVGHKYYRGRTNRAMNICINASMVTMAMYLVSAVTSGIYIGRIPIYTTLHGYAVLPWLIDQIFEKASAKLIKLLMILFYLLFYYYQMSQWGLL